MKYTHILRSPPLIYKSFPFTAQAVPGDRRQVNLGCISDASPRVLHWLYLKAWLPAKSVFADVYLDQDEEQISCLFLTMLLLPLASAGRSIPSQENQNGDGRERTEKRNPQDPDTTNQDKLAKLRDKHESQNNREAIVVQMQLSLRGSCFQRRCSEVGSSAS